MSSPDEPKVLIEYITQKGASFEAQLGKLENYVQNEGYDPINAKLRLDSLATLYQDYLKHKDRLMSLQTDHALIESFPAVEVRYFEVATAVTKLQRADLSASRPLANSTMNSSVVISERHDLPRLSKVHVPQFDGDHDKWLIFKNKFIALVHSREDLSNTVKHSQLENALSGRALKKIAEFVPSESDYPKAWQVLLDAYDHKRLLINEHLDAILNLPVISKAVASDLSALVDKTRQHISMLEQLGERPGDGMIVRILERRLPPAVLSRWEDRLEMDEMPSLETLYKFIQATEFKLRSLEKTNIGSGGDSRKRPGDKLDGLQPKGAKAGARSLVTLASNSAGCHSPQCDDNHPLYKCPMFNNLKIQERWDIVKETGICRNCLSVHDSPCKSEARCKRCRREHHTLLHADKRAKPSKDINKLESIQNVSTTETSPGISES